MIPKSGYRFPCDKREALLELTDFGAAAFSAGLAVALLKSTVDFVASFI